MVLDHERLDVYHLALDFLVFANGIIGALPRGRSHLADQLARASLSIVLNLAEGEARQAGQAALLFDGVRLVDRIGGTA
jgi:four helix bundle protein